MTTSIADVASIVAAAAATVAAFQVYVVLRQLRSDHERSRRAAALDLMRFFVDRQATRRIRGVLALQFFEELPTSKVYRLNAREEFSVDLEWKDELRVFFDKVGVGAPLEQDGEVKLEKKHVRLLRSDVIHYLNTLETVATAWRHNVADRDMIEDEFASVILVRQNRTVLERLRAESGAFPSLNALAERLRTRGVTTEDKQQIA